MTATWGGYILCDNCGEKYLIRKDVFHACNMGSIVQEERTVTGLKPNEQFVGLEIDVDWEASKDLTLENWNKETAMTTSPDYAGLIYRLEDPCAHGIGINIHMQAASALRALLAENARLSSEIEALPSRYTIRQYEAECDSLHAQVAALEKDAARYRAVFAGTAFEDVADGLCGLCAPGSCTGKCTAILRRAICTAVHTGG